MSSSRVAFAGFDDEMTYITRATSLEPNKTEGWLLGEVGPRVETL